VKVLFHDLYWYGTEHKEDEKSRRYAIIMSRPLTCHINALHVNQIYFILELCATC